MTGSGKELDIGKHVGPTHSKTALGDSHGIAVPVMCPCKLRSGTLSRWRAMGGSAGGSVDEDKKSNKL